MPYSGKTFSLVEIKNHTAELLQEIRNASFHQDTEQYIPHAELEAALSQFFEVSEKIEKTPELLDSQDSEFKSIAELSDFGLQLMAGLEQWLDAANTENKSTIELITLSLAVWIHDQSGTLQYLENIVNALSQTANQTNEAEDLEKLHEIAEKITNSVHQSIKKDVDKSEPGRPWRILNLNHGIIATRTHDINIMNSVFQQLSLRLPDDAASFFADGMKQMEIVKYPEHVKQVMQKYYLLTNNPTLH